MEKSISLQGSQTAVELPVSGSVCLSSLSCFVLILQTAEKVFGNCRVLIVFRPDLAIDVSECLGLRAQHQTREIIELCHSLWRTRPSVIPAKLTQKEKGTGSFSGVPIKWVDGEILGALIIHCPGQLTQNETDNQQLLAFASWTEAEILKHVSQTRGCISLTASLLQTLRLSSPIVTQYQQPKSIVPEIQNQAHDSRYAIENNSLLKTVIDCTASYVHVRDLNGRYLYVNKEYETVFKCRNDEIFGTHYREVLPPELADDVYQVESEMIASGAPRRTENIVQRDDGPHIYLVIRSPLFDANGEIIGTCGVGMDITQKIRLEQEMAKALASLKISEERWEFALEGSGDGVWDWDIPAEKCIYSTQWKKMLGHDDSEISDSIKEWSDRIHPEDEAELMAAVEANFQGMTNTFSHEYRFRCKDGSYIWIHDRAMVVKRDDNGRPVRMVGTHTDISDRKNIEQLKAEFVSTVSHELRTPVTSIRGALGLLESELLGKLPDQALNLIKVAHRNSQRLIVLLNDILDMEKLMSGKMLMDIQTVNVSNIIEQAVDENKDFASTFNVSFEYAGSSAVALVKGDPERIKQVLANLLSNAAKFSHNDDVVKIRLIKEESCFKVAVIDMGEGIPEHFHSRIFEAFAQANNSNTRQQGGTGLGLNISKKLIQQMQGNIGFESAFGKGSTFWFTLPVA
ncbi:PAS domain-containing sensor histidine kinase [Undibacterium sp. Dicai25W]|uniref:PAS domain-containing sensor histidine kinase n=1 Tax=Undibacterium sp. Dicai25W TaxID=3413034 RepID=UPI003BF1BB36